MRNPLKELLERKTEEKRRQAEEQQKREDRLHELEEASQRNAGFFIPHPIQAIKNKKEIKKLQKEIATYEQQQNNKKLLLVLLGMFVICIGTLTGLTVFSNDELMEDTKSSQSTSEVKQISYDIDEYPEAEELKSENDAQASISVIKNDVSEPIVTTKAMAEPIVASEKEELNKEEKKREC